MKNCHHDTTDGAWKKFRKGVNSFWKIGKNSKNKREPAFDGNFPSTTFTTNHMGLFIVLRFSWRNPAELNFFLLENIQ